MNAIKVRCRMIRLFFKMHRVMCTYLGIIVLIGVTFHACIGSRSVKRMSAIEQKTLKSVKNTFSADTINENFLLKGKDTLVYVSDYKDRMAHVDSMSVDMYRLSERYREETSLLIDRAGAWMAFWITVICMLTGIGALIHHHNNKTELARQKKSFEDLLYKMRTAEIENQLSAVSHSIMSLTDVSFTTDTDAANILLKKHVRILELHFCHFVDLIAPAKYDVNEDVLHQSFIILSLLLDCTRKLPILVARPDLDIDIKVMEVKLTNTIELLAENSIGKEELKKQMRELKTEFSKLAQKLY